MWGGEALSTYFPSLFDLAAHKDTMMADIEDNTREEGGCAPCLLRSFND